MGKLYTPEDIAAGFQTTNSLNNNFAQIEYALDACLARTGDAPNNMLADLDMDSNDILNAGTVNVDQLLIDGEQIPSVEDITDAFATGQAAIDASVTAAETAETNAEAAQAAAETARDEAETAAASINLPTIAGGDADKFLQVKGDETGYELVTGELAPPFTTGDAEKVVSVNSGETSYELVSLYSGGTATADNDFTGGTIRWSKTGNVVTVTFEAPQVGGAYASNVASTTALIPAGFRPNVSMNGATNPVNGSWITEMNISTSGEVTLARYDWTGSPSNLSNSVSGFSTSYIVV